MMGAPFSNLARHGRDRVHQPDSRVPDSIVIERDRLECADSDAPPQSRFVRRQDQPVCAIPHRGLGIARGGNRRTGWVRMIMPDHPGTAGARRPVRGEQSGGIDLEQTGWIRCDVDGGLGGLDPLG